MYPVHSNAGTELKFGFAGGLEAPQLSNVDLNRDGKLDIFIFDRAGNVMIPMVYSGPEGEPNYEIEWDLVSEFPKLGIWAQMKDFNGDGLEDIFAATSSPGVQAIDVYRARLIENKLAFTRINFDATVFGTIPIKVGSNFSPLYSAWTDVPAFQDIDGDGDIDLLTFEPGGTFLAYYRNTSLDDGLGLDTLVFNYADPCWGKFRENDLSEEVFLSDDPSKCADTGEPPVQVRHSGSAEFAYDIDNDGDKDLLLGDLSSPHIKLLINGGDHEMAWMTSQVSKYPENSASVEIPYFVAPYILDIDHDGLDDLLAAANDDGFSENVDVLWYYRNRGTMGAPDFRLETRTLFGEDMIDFGTSARPAIMDVNADGLMDIIVGTGGYYDDGLRDPRLIYLKNTGTLQDPEFTIEDDDYLEFSAFASVPQWDFAPEAGDLDGDGDIDLLVGEFDGGLFYLENIAGADQPAEFKAPVYPYMDISVGAASTPSIADINFDGLNDIVVGERLGNNDVDGRCSNLNYFENLGEKGAPDFIGDPTQAPNTQCLGRVLYNTQAAIAEWSAPEFILTNEGVRAIIGSSKGQIRVYSNIGPSGTEPFTLENGQLGNIADGARTVPELEDIDGDGYYEMIIGNYRGGLTAYETDIVKFSSATTGPGVAEDAFRIYPNPAGNRITINGLSNEQVVVRDMTGREVVAIRSGISLDLKGLPAGMYLLSVYTENGIWSKRFVKN